MNYSYSSAKVTFSDELLFAIRDVFFYADSIIFRNEHLSTKCSKDEMSV